MATHHSAAHCSALTCNPGGWWWGRAGPLENGPHKQLHSLLTHLQPPRTQAYVKHYYQHESG